jgi:hypothetical protein
MTALPLTQQFQGFKKFIPKSKLGFFAFSNSLLQSPNWLVNTK